MNTSDEVLPKLDPSFFLLFESRADTGENDMAGTAVLWAGST